MDIDENKAESGERGRNRTYNLLIKSQLLCQLSYAPVLRKLLIQQCLVYSACFVIRRRFGRNLCHYCAASAAALSD
jgi:hypothetical protein